MAIIKDSQHSEMKAKKKAKEAGMSKEARERGHHGAPGAIIEEVCTVFGRTVGVAIVKAPKTTATCPECKKEMEVGKGLLVSCLNSECERVGAEQDRDRVSTQNLVDLYTEGEYTRPTARKSTPRFAKRHKKKIERVATPVQRL